MHELYFSQNGLSPLLSNRMSLEKIETAALTENVNIKTFSKTSKKEVALKSFKLKVDCRPGESHEPCGLWVPHHQLTRWRHKFPWMITRSCESAPYLFGIISWSNSFICHPAAVLHCLESSKHTVLVYAPVIFSLFVPLLAHFFYPSLPRQNKICSSRHSTIVVISLSSS